MVLTREGIERSRFARLLFGEEELLKLKDNQVFIMHPNRMSYIFFEFPFCKKITNIFATDLILSVIGDGDSKCFLSQIDLDS